MLHQRMSMAYYTLFPCWTNNRDGQIDLSNSRLAERTLLVPPTGIASEGVGFETWFVLKLTWEKVARICADTVGVMARRCPNIKKAKIQKAEYPIADSKECAVRAEAAVPTSRRQRRMRQSFTRVRHGFFMVSISITQ